ncbi:MAG: segregation/condensation protein A [Candidatus Promineifilaceae bacterium]|nr:segregation/condensation protein A [Candidatus Promineifilaceae bacterium]
MPNPTRQLPAYRIELPIFNGPLDLLLHLIEREELDVTAISLTRVTEQYLEQVDSRRENIEHLIDFLVVGARLVLIKSRALLPRPPVLPEGEEEEDPADALLRQLRQYKQFKQAAGWLQKREEEGLRSYLRVAPPPRVERRPDLSGVTLAALLQALRELLARAEAQERSVEVIRPRRITIEGQLRHLRRTLRSRKRIAFQELLGAAPDVVEVAVTLLATLELIKRQEIITYQPEPFGPIEVEGVELSQEVGPAADASP